MNGRPLTDAKISQALRAHLPERADPGLRERILDAAETTIQQRALPSFFGALSAADPVVRRRGLLIAAALLVALALASVAAVGALRLLQPDLRDLSLVPLPSPRGVVAPSSTPSEPSAGPTSSAVLAPGGRRSMADIVLINPRFDVSYWGLEYALPVFGKSKVPIINSAVPTHIFTGDSSMSSDGKGSINRQEAIQTNVIGGKNVIDAAIDQGVKRVLAISTDKACQPVNLYGATKLCAEKLFVQANAYGHARGTVFGVVRYGNVIGSRGSVIPLFASQRASGTANPCLGRSNSSFGT